MPTSNTQRREPAFLWLFFGKVVLLMVTIAVVTRINPMVNSSTTSRSRRGNRSPNPAVNGAVAAAGSRRISVTSPTPAGPFREKAKTEMATVYAQSTVTHPPQASCSLRRPGFPSTARKARTATPEGRA